MGLLLDGEDLSPLLEIGLINENFSLSGYLLGQAFYYICLLRERL